MAIPNTPVPASPTVPNAPGVPPLLNQVDSIQADVVLLAADALSVIGMFAKPQWGLFTPSGAPAFAQASSGILSTVISALRTGSGSGGQSVGDVEYRQDNRISTAPQEQGAFLSYNKVSMPYAGRVTYVISGTEAQRAYFLRIVQGLQASTFLFNLITPEITYFNCNIVHHDYRRTARRGLTMIEVDIWVEEVRNVGTAAFTNTASASGASQVNGGTVQPQTLTATQQAAVAQGQVAATAGGVQ